MDKAELMIRTNSKFISFSIQ